MNISTNFEILPLAHFPEKNTATKHIHKLIFSLSDSCRRTAQQKGRTRGALTFNSQLFGRSAQQTTFGNSQKEGFGRSQSKQTNPSNARQKIRDGKENEQRQQVQQ